MIKSKFIIHAKPELMQKRSNTAQPGNLLYAQSGGVTSVINATAAAVITAARRSRKVGRVFAAKNGIIGVLREELIDTTGESPASIAGLAMTPGGAFGSCRFKLRGLHENAREYDRLLEVCQAHNIRYFLYNGGNDSADTSNKIAKLAAERGLDLICVGVPKTVDNDLAVTDNCPGFGSAAKYTAISTLEASLDVRSMSSSSTKVFILEVMGRHAGWLAAAAGLAGKKMGDAPHIILFPERTFDPEKFTFAVKAAVEKYGYCTVVASEGIKGSDGKFLSEVGLKDAFGHAQLGGVAPLLAGLVRDRLGYKYHWALPDYLQRSARHIASKLDARQAAEVGKAAVAYALAGMNAVMPIIRRISHRPYRYSIEPAPLDAIANHEKKMPEDFIRADGFGITHSARRYLEPLISGEAYPAYANGLPIYTRLKNKLVKTKLPPFKIDD
jgi:ATP-dependent phosphofructokinase / diphosphate-dependent phosphofructokinase